MTYLLRFDLDDFEFLWHTAMKSFIADHPYRFETNLKYHNRDYEDGQGVLYWFGQDQRMEALTAYKILFLNGLDPNLLWDTAQEHDGTYMGHCILTKYDCIGAYK